MLSFDRWQSLFQQLGLTANPLTFDQLQGAYRQPQRFYHTANHILDCLAHLDRHRALAQNPAAIELALWFHDAVYDSRAGDNEAQSADWATVCLKQQGATVAMQQRIEQLILATAGHCVSADPDVQLMLDIDLSILGQSPSTFARYDQAIRQEYAWVPEAVYQKKRRAVLQSFLQRTFIYQTSALRQRYESVARQNLTRSLKSYP